MIKNTFGILGMSAPPHVLEELLSIFKKSVIFLDSGKAKAYIRRYSFVAYK